MRGVRDQISILLMLLLTSVVTGQDDEKKEEEKLPDTPAIKAYMEGKVKVDKVNADIEKLFAKARTLSRDDVEEIRKLQADYVVKIEEMKKAVAGLRESSVAALKDAPKSSTIGESILMVAIGDIQSDKYIAAYDLLKSLMKSGNATPGINDAAAVAAFAINEFEAAKKYLETANENKEPLRLANRYRISVESLDDHIADYKTELSVRAKESTKNDLPRVKLETSAGNIVIELFENEAPQAVGNFVSLVEKKYYDGLIFHRVLPGFMAQGGCPDGRGSGGPGYKIYCECDKEGYRKHFAGTLSMAHAGPNTGGSQFFLTFLPTPHLDGKHTAFGRVIEGMDVLASLKRVDPSRPSGVEPSKIVKATVVRKRDHEYKPTKVE